MQYDELSKLLLACPEILGDLLELACWPLRGIVNLSRPAFVKELPTDNLDQRTPDALLELPVNPRAAEELLPGLPAPEDHTIVLLVEVTSRPRPNVLHQIANYLAQYQLRLPARQDSPKPVFVLIWCLGPESAKPLRTVAQAAREGLGFWPYAALPRFLLVESATKQARLRAWEQSVVLGFATEASVLAHKGRMAIRQLMTQEGDRLMAQFVEHKAAGRQECLSAVRAVVQFLTGLKSESPEAAEEWMAEVATWWRKLGLRHGLSEEEAMAEARTVYDYLLQKGIRRGLEQGIQQGIQQGLKRGLQEGMEKGRREGAVASLRQAIYDVLEERFGGVPKSVRRHVAETTDQERLAALHRQALHVDRPEDLLNGA